jgi:hypothetical protein
METIVAQVRSLLTDVHGRCADVRVSSSSGAATATLKVPYERA